MSKAVGRGGHGIAGRLRVIGTALLVLTLFGGTPLFGDAREFHKQGVEALESSRWADAERFFRAALAERSEERFNALLGRRYFPHYHLGVALAEQGDCRSALDAWQESRSQGKITRANELAADLDRRRRSCEERLTRIDQLASELDQLIAEGASPVETAESLSTRPELAPRWGASGGFGQRLAAAQEALDAARQRGVAAKVRQDLETLEQAEGEARQALEALQRVVSEARVELGDRTAAASRALESLEVTEGRARRQLRSATGLAPYPPDLARRVSALESLLRNVGQSKDSATPQQLADFDQQLQDAISRLRRAAALPPDALIDAVEAHLAGDSLAVLEALDAAGEFRDGRARAHGCLLRAAALHSLFVQDSTQPSAPPEEDGLDASDPSLDLAEASSDLAGDGSGAEGSDGDGTAVDSGVDPSSSEVPLEGGEAAEPIRAAVTALDLESAIRVCAELEPAPDPERRFFSPRFLDLYWTQVDQVAAERLEADAADSGP